MSVDTARRTLLLNQRHRPVLDMNFLSTTTLDSRSAFARDGAGTYETSTGDLLSFASGEPRIGDQGLLIEPERTNYFLNNETPATHTSPTLPVGLYLLWCEGTGSIAISANTATISGVNGASVTEGAPDLFSVDVEGTVDFTVTGDVDVAQCEGPSPAIFQTSLILTEGAAVTRPADVFTLDLSASNTSEGTLFIDCVRLNDGQIGQTALLTLDDGTQDNRAAILRNSNPSLGIRGFVVSGGVGSALLSSAADVAAFVPIRAAVAWRADDFALCSNASAAVVDSAGAVPAPMTTLRLGASALAVDTPILVRRVRCWSRRLPNDILRGMTV